MPDKRDVVICPDCQQMVLRSFNGAISVHASTPSDSPEAIVPGFTLEECSASRGNYYTILERSHLIDAGLVVLAERG